jgi:hypothetical protein
MTYLVEIKETTESKPLIELLKTLKYVKLKKATREVQTDKEIVKAIKKSEKGKHIKWEDAKKEIMAWK